MLVKRMFVVACDFLVALTIACVAVLSFAPPAYAYVDPSVMTYTIQALAGVAVALSAVMGVVWRRTRKKLLRVLNIDENANKEVEPDVHRVDPLDRKAVEQTDNVAPRRSRRASARGAVASVRLSWPRRFLFALVVSAFVVYTVGIVAPYEIVAGGSGSLIFGLSDVWAPLAVFAVILALVMALLLSIARGRAFSVLLAVVFALGVGAYVQAMFLNSSLPAADGVAVIWGDYTTVTVISSAVWLAIFALLVVFCLRMEGLFRSVVTIASVALVVVQSVGVASLWLGPEKASAEASASSIPEEKVYVTEEGLFDVSSKSNVIVFVLDTFDTFDMQNMLAETPDMLDELTGFTYFPDSVGSMIPTRYGVPYLLTGELPKTSQTYSQFVDGIYSRSTFLDEIREQGYSIGLYTDSILSNEVTVGMDIVASKTENIHPLGKVAVDNKQTILTLWKCALYRDAPWLFKAPFWFYTDEMNESVLSKGESDYADIPYTMNDVDYYDTLASDRLSIADKGEKGSFRFIHLQGAHGPYVMDENAHASDTATFEAQCRGSIEIVNEYVRQLKELGVYDSSTIIVTADHGNWGLVEELEGPTSPILLVKPAADDGESESPVEVSTVPTGHVDYPATVIDAVGGDSSKWGETVFEVTDGARTRYYYMTASDGKRDRALKEFEINGDVLDFDNWQLTGNIWDCDL